MRAFKLDGREGFLRVFKTLRLYFLVGAFFCCIVILGVLWEGGHVPAFVDLILRDADRFVTRTLFYVGGQPVRVLFVIKTLLFFVFLNIISRFARRSVHVLARHTSRLDEHREYLLSRAISFSIYAIGILIGVNVEQINIGTLVILGGTLGVAVGFGLQSLVSNLVAGLVLLIEQPIRLGDKIEVGERSGEVLRVGSRSSWIRTYDNAILIMPNVELVTKEILNWTAADVKSRISVTVSVAYGTNSEAVIQTLLEIACRQVDVLGDPAPSVILSSLGPSSVTFVLSVWTLIAVNNFGQLRSNIYLTILRRFREEEIALPFPQLDLHLKSTTNIPELPNDASDKTLQERPDSALTSQTHDCAD